MSKWKKTQISEFLFERKGKYKPNDKLIDGLSRIEKIDFSGNFYIAKKPSQTNMILIKKGDLVISGINVAKGAMGIYSNDEDVVATIHYSSYNFDDTKINVAYFKRFLKSSEFIRLIEEQIKGGIKTEIKPKHILPLEILLPQLDEQELIVKHFESVENEDLLLNNEVKNQQTLVKKLRQQILQEAIEGKLTKDWRELNPDIEDASELLKLIQSKKEQLIKDKKIKKQKELPSISEEEKPFEIPTTWEWYRLGSLCSKTGSGSTPSGGKSAYLNKGIKFVRSQNVYNNGFRWNGEAYISEETHMKMKGTQLFSNDLLLNITGGSIGRCCILSSDFDYGNINQHIAIIRLIFSNSRYYIHKVICSNYFQNAIKDTQTGAGREGLPKNRMDKMLIPFPPILEQKEIVKKVDKLFAICDELETQITSNQSNVKDLMQAVLKEAFAQEDQVA